jgi:hypothetical protein
MDLIGNIEVVGAWDEKIGASAQTLELGLLAKVLSDKR